MAGDKFRKWLKIEVALLVITFLFGMLINLFISIPATPTASFWDALSTWVIRAHMLLGLAILAIAGSLLKWSFKPLLGAGFAFVVVALLSGIGFLFGGADNIFSYTMAIGFLGALVCYVFQLGALRGRKAI